MPKIEKAYQVVIILSWLKKKNAKNSSWSSCVLFPIFHPGKQSTTADNNILFNNPLALYKNLKSQTNQPPKLCNMEVAKKKQLGKLKTWVWDREWWRAGDYWTTACGMGLMGSALMLPRYSLWSTSSSISPTTQMLSPRTMWSPRTTCSMPLEGEKTHRGWGLSSGRIPSVCLWSFSRPQ